MPSGPPDGSILPQEVWRTHRRLRKCQPGRKGSPMGGTKPLYLINLYTSRPRRRSGLASFSCLSATFPSRTRVLRGLDVVAPTQGTAVQGNGPAIENWQRASPEHETLTASWPYSAVQKIKNETRPLGGRMAQVPRIQWPWQISRSASLCHKHLGTWRTFHQVCSSLKAANTPSGNPTGRILVSQQRTRSGYTL